MRWARALLAVTALLAAGAGAAEASPATMVKNVSMRETAHGGGAKVHLAFTACGARGTLRLRILETLSPFGEDAPVRARMRRAAAFGQLKRCVRREIFWTPQARFLRRGRYGVRLRVKAGAHRFSRVVHLRRDHET